MAGTRKSNEPGMSYRRVLNLFVTTQDGERCSIVGCPAGAFQVLLLVALQTIPKASAREAAAKALADANLDYAGATGKVDRWFAISTLVEYNAAIPLFAPSKESARSGHRKKEAETMTEVGSRRPGLQGIDTTVPYNLALPVNL